MKKLIVVFLLSCFVAIGSCKKEISNKPFLKIAAAADLEFALKKLATKFEKHTNTSLLINFGSTGILARQIEQGADVDVFLSADKNFVQKLVNENLIFSDSVINYAQGVLVIWQSEKKPILAKELKDLLSNQIKRIAIANPEHAPYGIAAIQAFKATGIDSKVREKLIIGESSSQAFQFTKSGNTDVAITALSLVFNQQGHLEKIDQKFYTPLSQTAGILKNTNNEITARAFLKYILSKEGQLLLEANGFMSGSN